jgi:limonene-1,2-epoxide hydrolase
LGRTEDTVNRYNEAFLRGDVDGVLKGWHPKGLLTPLGGRRTYRGHAELRLYLETDIHQSPEFDFRIYTILEQGRLALTFGRYSVREGDAVVDKSVFCISEVLDDKFVSWEAYENVAEAFSELRRRLDDQ